MPRYEPERWNDGDGIQDRNNCYDYARDQQTGNFTQPGEQHGWNLRDDPYRCAEVTEAAVADGLRISTQHADCGRGCWKVALAVDPDPSDSDYHWYRQDDGGRWSHKVGEEPARDWDDSHAPIVDPQTADRGAYTEFCGWFCVCARAREEEAGTIEAMGRPSDESEPPTAHMQLWSGRRNPSIGLTDEEVAEVRRLMADAPARRRAPVGGLGYGGCAVRFGGRPQPGAPDAVRAFDGALTVSAGGRVEYFDDVHGLESWLLRRFRATDAWEAAARRIAKTAEPGAAAREALGS